MIYFNKRLFSKGKIVSFFGLGNMGLPMAANLAKGGFEVFGMDGNEANLKSLPKYNIKPMKNLEETISDSDYIITMLPNTQTVLNVYKEFPNLISLSNKNSLLIDCSTISPVGAIELHKQSNLKHKKFIDCPVSGGITSATSGSLTFMVGTESNEIFNKAKDVLKHMGTNIINCEMEGGGQVAKACNNMALAIQMISVAESFALAKKLGLNEKKFFEIASKSTSRCWSLDTYNPVPGVLNNVPASNNYDTGFKTSLMVKDLKISIKAAKDVGINTELAETALKMYEKLIDNGFKDKDFGIVYDYILNN